MRPFSRADPGELGEMAQLGNTVVIWQGERPAPGESSCEISMRASIVELLFILVRARLRGDASSVVIATLRLDQSGGSGDQISPVLIAASSLVQPRREPCQGPALLVANPCFLATVACRELQHPEYPSPAILPLSFEWPGCVTPHLDLFIITALFASALIQGLSGVGFSLIAAPAIAQAVPGASAIGLVNLLALSQNSFMLWREDGHIHWPIVRRLFPGLILGVIVGLLLSQAMPNSWRPLVVAGSSLGSLTALLLWRPGTGRPSALFAASWSGTVNSYAGVGGPPLASYLVHLGLDEGDYVRTQQLCFAFLNVASIPFLGLPSITVGWLVVAIGVIVVGTIVGRWARRFFTPDQAHRITFVVIGLVASVALIRSILTLVS